MTGTITFPLPDGGIARFSLDSILNVHTDGSGILKFNVIATTSEFDFTCADEAAAVRIADLITKLQQTGSSSDFPVDDSINYPLPAIPTSVVTLLNYDYLNNRWNVTINGTNLTSVGSISVAGVTADIASLTATDLLTASIDKPAYGTLDVDLYDSKMNFLVTFTISFFYTLNTFVPNPFIGGTNDFVINGSDFDNSTLGTVWVEDYPGAGLDFNSGSCPATFVSALQLSCPAADWNPGDGGAGSPPLFIIYRDSAGKLSNAVYAASAT